MSEAAGDKKRRFGPELLIEIPAVIVTFVMMVHITANALLRTFADAPIQNTLEIVQHWYLPIVAFLGFVAAQHRAQHIAADLVYERLPKVTQRFVLSGVFAVSSIVSLGFAWFGLDEARHSQEIGRTAGVSDVISWPTYYLVPLAFGILTIQLAWAAVRAITHPEDDHFVTDPEDDLLLEQAAIDAAIAEEHALKADRSASAPTPSSTTER